MHRSFISSGLILALIVVLLGGACLACSKVLAGQPLHRCCQTGSHCPMPVKNAKHQHCSGPASDLPSANHVAKVVSNDVVFDARPAHGDLPAAPLPRMSAASDIPFSPPDLCLLNSVLTI